MDKHLSRKEYEKEFSKFVHKIYKRHPEYFINELKERELKRVKR